ncbi:Protein of unknown function [Gryllus bimaculatus]|nr:Protein of unknown function [Gryllus bimaculatus]
MEVIKCELFRRALAENNRRFREEARLRPLPDTDSNDNGKATTLDKSMDVESSDDDSTKLTVDEDASPKTKL